MVVALDAALQRQVVTEGDGFGFARANLSDPDVFEAEVGLRVANEVARGLQGASLARGEYAASTEPEVLARAIQVLTDGGIWQPRAEHLVRLSAEIGRAHFGAIGLGGGFAVDSEQVLRVLQQHFGARQPDGALAAAASSSSRVGSGVGIAPVPEGVKVGEPLHEWVADIGTGEPFRQVLRVVDARDCDREAILGRSSEQLHFMAGLLPHGPVAVEGLAPPLGGATAHYVNYPRGGSLNESPVGSIINVDQMTGEDLPTFISDPELIRFGENFGSFNRHMGPSGNGWIEYHGIDPDPGHGDFILDKHPNAAWMVLARRWEAFDGVIRPHIDNWYTGKRSDLTILVYDHPAESREDGTLVMPSQKLTERFLHDDPFGDGRHPNEIQLRRSPARFSDLDHFTMPGALQYLATDGCLSFPLGSLPFNGELSFPEYSQAKSDDVKKWFADAAADLLAKEGYPYVPTPGIGSMLCFQSRYVHSSTPSVGFRAYRRPTVGDTYGLFPGRGIIERIDPYDPKYGGEPRLKLESRFPRPPMESHAANLAWRFGLDLVTG